MAEIIGVAASVAQLLEVAFRLIARTKKAYDRQSNLIGVLHRHSAEIESVKTIVEIILDEDVLQTALVALELENMGAVTKTLVQYLRDLNPGSKSQVRQIAHQLMHGTKEEEKLAGIMADFSRTKFNLSLRVQLANVGLTQVVHDTIIANVEVVNRIDRLLGEITGQAHGLKLASLIKDGQPKGRNLVAISKFELASTGWEGMEEFDTDITFDNEGMDRIIAGNTAQDSAVQLLGPVGRDMWEDIRVRIEDNKASGHAAQFVYPTDFATFKYLLDHQERMAVIESQNR
ncbi:hypothetical protein VTL71DRAFT_11182 [Oculimacula yallundae]|uniref:NACHT-NTPase and P-loop NTPases N-terminal domain-containing protein n=1 Tax=Oculimacula yallundae TaxID=86028 RepID=A0ABR4CV84_9HELO